MEALAASRPRGRRWTNVLERPSVLASVLISPAVIFILALVGGPLALAIYLSFTNAIGGSLHGKWIGLGNFRHEWTNPEITAVPLAAGLAPYLDWVRRTTSKQVGDAGH